MKELGRGIFMLLVFAVLIGAVVLLIGDWEGQGHRVLECTVAGGLIFVTSLMFCVTVERWLKS